MRRLLAVLGVSRSENLLACWRRPTCLGKLCWALGWRYCSFTSLGHAGTQANNQAAWPLVHDASVVQQCLSQRILYGGTFQHSSMLNQPTPSQAGYTHEPA